LAFYQFYTQRKVSPVGKNLADLLAKKVYDTVKRHTPAQGKVFEIGCGEGRVAALLTPHFDYYGYEPSPALSNNLRSKSVKVDTKTAPPIEYDSNTFDAVIAIHVLEHMDSITMAREFVQEVYRVLKPGGHFFVLCPDFLDMGKCFFDVDYSHTFITTPTRMDQLLCDNNYRIETTTVVYGAFEGVPGIVLNLLAKVMVIPLRVYKELLGKPFKFPTKAQYLFARAIFKVAQKQ